MRVFVSLVAFNLAEVAIQREEARGMVEACLWRLLALIGERRPKLVGVYDGDAGCVHVVYRVRTRSRALQWHALSAPFGDLDRRFIDDAWGQEET